MSDSVVVDIEEPQPPKPPDNGPRLNWVGAIFLVIAALGIGSCFFLPPPLVWIGVVVGGIGCACLVFWAVLSEKR